MFLRSPQVDPIGKWSVLAVSRSFPPATVQTRANEVELNLLCRPPDYADLGVRSGYRVMGPSQV